VVESRAVGSDGQIKILATINSGDELSYVQGERLRPAIAILKHVTWEKYVDF
jgi:hypothetical protein